MILMGTLNIPLLCRRSKKISLNYCHLLPNMTLWLTLSGSNNPYLEPFFLVLKMFDTLRCDCIWHMKRKEFASKRRILFPFTVDHFSEGTKSTETELPPLKVYSFPLRKQVLQMHRDKTCTCTCAAYLLKHTRSKQINMDITREGHSHWT